MSFAFRKPILVALCAPLVLGCGELLANDAKSSAASDHRAPQSQNKPGESKGNKAESPLVEKVRAATARFKDINVALSEGWVQGTPCVSGPNSGAMGVHFVQPSRLDDGVLNAAEPEALIYEPLPGGRVRLVGVEFITLASAWEAHNPDAGAPSLDGHLMHYVGAPNRYGLPAFYQLHVWAWERNPDGNFADWNSLVSCDHQ